MPGRGKGHFNAFYRLESFVVMEGFKVFQGFPGILHGKQGLRMFVLREFLAEGVLGILFLQKTRIRKEHFAQIVGALSAVNFAFEAVFNQCWQVTCVVYMGMGQNHGINSAWVYRKLRPIPSAQGFHALVHAAINQHTMLVVGKQVA